MTTDILGRVAENVSNQGLDARRRQSTSATDFPPCVVGLQTRI